MLLEKPQQLQQQPSLQNKPGGNHPSFGAHQMGGQVGGINDQLEYPFITIKKFPPGLIQRYGEEDYSFILHRWCCAAALLIQA